MTDWATAARKEKQSAWNGGDTGNTNQAQGSATSILIKVLVQSVGDFQLIFKESTNSQQLTEIALVFHQWQMLFNIIENIGDATCIEAAEIQIERKIPCVDVLSHDVYCSLMPIIPSIRGVNVRTSSVSTDFKKSS